MGAPHKIVSAVSTLFRRTGGAQKIQNPLFWGAPCGEKQHPPSGLPPPNVKPLLLRAPSKTRGVQVPRAKKAPKGAINCPPNDVPLSGTLKGGKKNSHKSGLGKEPSSLPSKTRPSSLLWTRDPPFSLRTRDKSLSFLGGKFPKNKKVLSWNPNKIGWRSWTQGWKKRIS